MRDITLQHSFKTKDQSFELTLVHLCQDDLFDEGMCTGAEGIDNSELKKFCPLSNTNGY